MNTDLKYLFRTAQLANLADNRVLDSPRVGSVLINNDKIIGEGYHQQAGHAHAEVHCLHSVKPEHRGLIPASTLYVSLEPCCIVGKTGACTDLILRHKIKTVVIGQRDATPGVAGRGVSLLRAAGVEVREYPDLAATARPGRFRHTFVTEGRPHITLKWAQSGDGYIRPADRRRNYWITNPVSRRLVHRWRAGTAGILVGARTVLDDAPSLTTRFSAGPDATPILLDPRGRLTGREPLFSGPLQPLHYTSRTDGQTPGQIRIDAELSASALWVVLNDLRERRMANITVEGGAAVLKAFIRHGLWDEARVFTGGVRFGTGLAAPAIEGAIVRSEWIGTDRLVVYQRAGGAARVLI